MRASSFAPYEPFLPCHYEVFPPVCRPGSHEIFRFHPPTFPSLRSKIDRLSPQTREKQPTSFCCRAGAKSAFLSCVGGSTAEMIQDPWSPRGTRCHTEVNPQTVGGKEGSRGNLHACCGPPSLGGLSCIPSCSHSTGIWGQALC